MPADVPGGRWRRRRGGRRAALRDRRRRRDDRRRRRLRRRLRGRPRASAAGWAGRGPRRSAGRSAAAVGFGVGFGVGFAVGVGGRRGRGRRAWAWASGVGVGRRPWGSAAGSAWASGSRSGVGRGVPSPRARRPRDGRRAAAGRRRRARRRSRRAAPPRCRARGVAAARRPTPGPTGATWAGDDRVRAPARGRAGAPRFARSARRAGPGRVARPPGGRPRRPPGGARAPAGRDDRDGQEQDGDDRRSTADELERDHGRDSGRAPSPRVTRTRCLGERLHDPVCAPSVARMPCRSRGPQRRRASRARPDVGANAPVPDTIIAPGRPHRVKMEDRLGPHRGAADHRRFGSRAGSGPHEAYRGQRRRPRARRRRGRAGGSPARRATKAPRNA